MHCAQGRVAPRHLGRASARHSQSAWNAESGGEEAPVSPNRLGYRRAYVKVTGLPMHVLISIVLVLGCGLVLIAGLVSVMQALLNRTISKPHLISEENPHSERLHNRSLEH